MSLIGGVYLIPDLAQESMNGLKHNKNLKIGEVISQFDGR